MKNSKKRGFTIIELVIVIAVIAILAGVLIPTFVSVINKANEANDTALIKYLNTSLAGGAIGGKAPATMQGALDIVEADGYNVAKIKATASGARILWDSKNNCFVYLKNGENQPTYIPDSKAQNTADEDLWEIVESVDSNNKYSQYLNNNTDTTVTVSSGFDSGVNTRLTSVNYVNKSGAKSVVLNTNGQMCELTVDAPADHVEHYGYAKKTTVIAVDSNNSYHEYGTSSELVVTAGKVVIESTGIVFDLKTTESATAVVSNNGGNVMKSSVESVKASDVFTINSLAQLEAFRDATNSGVNFAEYNTDSKKIVLNCDITLTSAWRPISNYHRSNSSLKDKWFAGYFDGNGHTIYGLTNVGLRAEELNSGFDTTTPKGKTEFVYGFFAAVNGAKITNLNFADVDIDADESDTFKGDHVAALVGYAAGDVQISNITVKGQIVGYDGTAGIVGGIRESTATGAKIENCKNYATLKTARRSAGIVGNINSTGNVTISKCENYGSITIDNELREIRNAVAGIALIGIPTANEHDIKVSIVDCVVGDSVAIQGSTDTFVGRVAMIYSNQYQYNSKGNILKTNADDSDIANHVVTIDVCGTLTAKSVKIEGGCECDWNWNNAK